MYATYILYDDILKISTVDKNFTVFTENVMDFCPMHDKLIILFQDNTVKVYQIVNNIFIEKVMDCMDFGVYSIHITTTTYFFMDADGVIHSRNISGKITKSDSKYSIKINGGSYI